MRLFNWIKECICKKGNHKWHNYRALQYVETSGFTGFSNVPMRECENCGKTEKRFKEFRT